VIAAIYARKSNDQNGVADDQKSVARQVEHARAYATRKGWAVADDHVYVDDGIGGAEFANRPGFVRLMAAAAQKPRPPFEVLVMSEESRLGREQIEVSYAIKQLVSSGVRVFCYLTDAERTLDSPIEKAMLALQTMADEMEREKARMPTFDALRRKAAAGYVAGGRCFGYENVTIEGAKGERSHVKRRINEAEAAIVRQIYELYAGGQGLVSIAKQLNFEGAPCPRARVGRVEGWSPSSVREVIRRPLYRGAMVWNKTKRRDQWGQMRFSRREASEWITVDAPELRIVTPELAATVDEPIASMHSRMVRLGDGRLLGRPPGESGRHLLTGIVACGRCGGTFEALNRPHGAARASSTSARCIAERAPPSVRTVSPCRWKRRTSRYSTRSRASCCTRRSSSERSTMRSRP
jgi:DNA invertase Pin-like site-specific DNA recombinase